MINPAHQEVDPTEYWRRPADLQLPRAYWEDPEPEVRGMLSADRIQYYTKLVRMIEPFETINLKPASYALTLGPRYQIEGKDGVLTEEKSVLEIPPNSIAFVSMREMLLLPHYIAARFNLSIDLIYQGLLLGTGPQVDPGFQGVLSCPLHNISNNPIRIFLGDHFATIDFVKTTGLGEKTHGLLARAQTEDELYAGEEDLVGYSGFKNRLFNRNKRWLKPILGYPAGRIQVRSSVAPLEQKIRRWTIGGLIGLVVFLSLVVSLIGLNVASYRLYVDTGRNREQILETMSRVQADHKEVTRAQQLLEARLREIEEKLAKPRVGKP